MNTRGVIIGDFFFYEDEWNWIVRGLIYFVSMAALLSLMIIKSKKDNKKVEKFEYVCALLPFVNSLLVLIFILAMIGNIVGKFGYTFVRMMSKLFKKNHTV